ncbi:hypothetical protein DFQ14_11268 [Halopolyspora algeriensis]|uniref:Gram-positive cocci surface proteins LPxTG domain-containing protein n=1 Tax=Halopolyspora algeriensis TaxID=1500506 RepID=A0A368VG15_9ACTN|nr:hypothetical protein [Halopolyspora algeriensis]RCW40188.1 hypothetical protein DFQ14_11268 [Halopolyspora algeriensis]TQM46330.1 hypothetical protein FHU43_4002 [Halopolyspora algeriensis]
MRLRSFRRVAACSAASLAAVCLTLPAATAQSAPPTTPVPEPQDPGQPPASQPPPVAQPGPVVAEAGTGIGMLRVLPDAVPGDSIIDDPEFDDKLPKQSLLEAGMGIAVAQANSEAYLAQERAIAESAPFGFAVGGNMPQLPGSLTQTALPDHAQPTTSGLRPPSSPASKLFDAGLVEGSVHARWDKRLGPCAQPIADAETSLAGVSAVNALPALPSGPGESASLLSGSGASSEEDTAAVGALAERLGDMAGPLSRLGGLLEGRTEAKGEAGSLLSVPGAIRAHSTTRLVDVPSQDGKAVRAVSRFRIGSLRLFAGTKQQLRVDVVSEPTLTATSTGDPKTSTVEYQAPVLRVSQGGETLGTLSATDPKLDVPIGVPMPGSGVDSDLPLVGHPEMPDVVDIGVLRLSIGDVQKSANGDEVRALARMLDVTLLPGEPLGLDTSLAKISFGEQAVRADAPAGGVHCDVPASAAPPAAPATSAAPAAVDSRSSQVPRLAVTSGAYHTVPLFWTGTALLLAGAVLVAATPRRN